MTPDKDFSQKNYINLFTQPDIIFILNVDVQITHVLIVTAELNVTFLNVTFYQLMQVAMFLHVQILQGSVIVTDGTPISSGHYVLQGARPALRWSAAIGGLGGGALWDEDTFVISLEEGHYAAYIKNYMAMQIIFGSGVATGREEEEQCFLSDVTDLPTHHLCCFAVFGCRNFYFAVWFCTCFGVSDSLCLLSLLFGFGSCCLANLHLFLYNLLAIVIYNCVNLQVVLVYGIVVLDIYFGLHEGLHSSRKRRFEELFFWLKGFIKTSLIFLLLLQYQNVISDWHAAQDTNFVFNIINVLNLNSDLKPDHGTNLIALVT
ncbi:hypothetical protein ACJX0J_033615 [Zea mays]